MNYILHNKMVKVLKVQKSFLAKTSQNVEVVYMIKGIKKLVFKHETNT